MQQLALDLLDVKSMAETCPTDHVAVPRALSTHGHGSSPFAYNTSG